MAEKGPLLRRGTVTNRITAIGTTATGTGLPPENVTTSFINESIGNAASFGSNNSPITNSNAGTTLPTPPTATVYYKMVGYYVTGAVYESFVVTGSPTSASTTNPNTGHALINTFVAQTWTSSS